MSDTLLYGFPLSANSHRVRLMMSLLGLPFEERTVDLARGEQFAADFTAINPQRRVPVLIDNRQVLTESCAILIYLAERLDGEERERWWPSDPAERAAVAAWLFFTVNDLHNGIGLARNERSFRIPSGGDYAAARADAALNFLEQRLQAHDYLALGRRPWRTSPSTRLPRWRRRLACHWRSIPRLAAGSSASPGCRASGGCPC